MLIPDFGKQFGGQGLSRQAHSRYSQLDSACLDPLMADLSGLKIMTSLPLDRHSRLKFLKRGYSQR